MPLWKASANPGPAEFTWAPRNLREFCLRGFSVRGFSGGCGKLLCEEWREERSGERSGNLSGERREERSEERSGDLCENLLWRVHSGTL